MKVRAEQLARRSRGKHEDTKLEDQVDDGWSMGTSKEQAQLQGVEERTYSW